MSKTYDPNKMTCAFANILVTGYADGTFINVARSEDGWNEEIGAGGEVVRVKNQNKTGTVTITLMKSSPVNALLSAKYRADELVSGAGKGPLLIKDLNGTTVVQSTEAWIKKMPDLEYGKEHGSVEWVIFCEKLQMDVGGSLT